jgi:predicted Ser/Thr protein kinase
VPKPIARVVECLLVEYMDGRCIQCFGRYEVLNELGRGAMGVVYKARDPRINRLVAVKTISLIGQSSEDESEYRQRFFREAEAAGRLSHPGIVTVFDAGEEPETRAPYIVMEFVGGESLEKMLARNDRKLPVATALQLTMEVAEALDNAHCMGVVHRDLKPANILLTADGHAKIADFGVAKLNLAHQSSMGRAVGTPAYMSPEQLNGDVVDGRSDLFSLGVILYTILTGHRPFQGNSALTVSYKVVNRDPIPATLLDTELPSGLDYIITRAMAKDPRDRYQRGMEMVLDIQHLQQGKEPWSKAWQAGASTEATAAQISKNKARPAALNGTTISYKSKATPAARPLRQPAVAEAKKLARQRLHTGAWVAIAFLFFGVAMISINRRIEAPRTIAHLQMAEPVLKISMESPGASASASVPHPLPVGKLPSQKTNIGDMAKPVVQRIRPAKTDGRSGAEALASARPAAGKFEAARATAATISPATLEIEVEHKFPMAHLAIWVDNQFTYTHLMAGNDKKTLGVFHHVTGHEFHATQIPAGKHRLRVQVTAAAGQGSAAYNRSASVDGDFASGQESKLQVSFEKNGEMKLSLQ